MYNFVIASSVGNGERYAGIVGLIPKSLNRFTTEVSNCLQATTKFLQSRQLQTSIPIL